jgi:peptidase C25-like protein
MGRIELVAGQVIQQRPGNRCYLDASMKRLLGVALLLVCCAASPARAAPPGASLEPQFVLAGQRAAKILVAKDGWYRVRFADLRKVGFAVPKSTASLRLYTDGAQVAMQVKRTAIEFYGQALDTPTADVRTYWLLAGKGAALRIPVARAGATPTAPQGRFAATVTAVQREIYYTSLLNGPSQNFYGQAIRVGKPINVVLNAPHPDTAVPGSLRLVLHGYSLVPHVVKVSLNGTAIGTLNFRNQEDVVANLAVPAGVIKDGENVLALVGGGGEIDFSLPDSAALIYQHLPVADSDVVSFGVRPAQRISVGGFSSRRVRVVDISRPDRPRELAPTVSGSGGNYTITLKAPAGAKQLLAFADAKATLPALELNAPSRLNARTQSADLLMISHSDFIPALKPLIDLRQRAGLKVVVADITDVYDEFSFGVHGPEAITTFLRWTKEHWQRAPRYVLLVGDATYDPRNFTKTGNFDFVPTTFVDTQYAEAPSDDKLADFNGDAVPEMAVGRLPIRTADSAATIVGKIVDYETGPGKARRDVLLVADKNIDYDFEAESRTLFGLIPSNVTINTLYRNQGPTDAAVRSRLLAALNQGPTVVNFFGHGSTSIWTNASILKASDAAALTNKNSLSLYLMMTCLNGYFVEPNPAGASLGETLVTAANGGAIATWSSSGLTVPTDQVRADQEAVRLLMNDSTMTLGDAMLRGKQVIRDIDVRHTWTLLGDPATKLH